MECHSIALQLTLICPCNNCWSKVESVLYEFEGVLDFGKDADTNKLVVEVEDYVCPRELITELNKLKRVTAELRGAQQGSQNNQAQFHNKFDILKIEKDYIKGANQTPINNLQIKHLRKCSVVLQTKERE
ncbi:hypothetical protein ACFX2H_045675 [Malus domestica]